MNATREQVDDKLMVIKLFASNYARDLLYSMVTILIHHNKHSCYMYITDLQNEYG
jgi:hypothetical protein